MQSAETTEQVYSNLADDPDLAELVDLYVASLPQLVATVREHADHADWRALECAAHQLKGSSGCYGFDEVSSRAGRLEQACRGGQPRGQILAALVELERLCSRVRSKQPK